MKLEHVIKVNKVFAEMNKDVQPINTNTTLFGSVFGPPTNTVAPILNSKLILGSPVFTERISYKMFCEFLGKKSTLKTYVKYFKDETNKA